MTIKELSLSSLVGALVLSSACVVSDDPGQDTDTDTNPTTMTASASASNTDTMTDPTMGTSTTNTTDPDTTDTETDTSPDTDTDTDTDTEGGDPNVYDFREDGPDAYTQVDRMGFPGVNTALINPENQDTYNASSPTNDAAGDFLTDVAGSISYLHTGGMDGDGLEDDVAVALAALNPDLTPQQIQALICNPPGDIDPNDTCVAQGGPFVFPDVILIDTNTPAGFPNGRGLETPVIDIVLAVLLLDVLDAGKAPVFPLLNAFADLDPETDGNQGLSQSGNDVEFPGSFPYLAPAHE